VKGETSMMANYFRREILKNMAAIEDITGKMFHEMEPELFDKWIEASDSEDVKKLGSVHAKICRIVDRVRRLP
jgi:hypothetical protein